MPELTEIVEIENTEPAAQAPDIDESAEAADVRQPSTRVMCCDQAV